ncbi:MAG: alanine racemase [Bacteroidales bacterium]|jgi:D-serine deaminase-like pyridoxal phosphate-dependent protein
MKIIRPTYLINPETCKGNIRNMAVKAAQSGVIFRPHFKTHQSLVIGRWFREAGVSRITVSSLTAAEFFAQDGWDDITVAFPVNLPEIDLMNRLAGKIRLGLLVEHPPVVKTLATRLESPVDVYIKIDTGYHRTGLTLDEMPDITELASIIRESPMMRLTGLLTHAGHTYHASGPDEIVRIYHSAVQILNIVREKLGEQGRELVLSYGDTPSCATLASFPGIDEIRPGCFVFYDLMQLFAGVCRPEQIGGIVVCPVVAVHESRNQAVLYGGAIHFSKESLSTDHGPIYGQLVEMSNYRWHRPVSESFMVSLSQEHGILEAPPEVIRNLQPGALVGIIPVHSCLTANLIRGYRFPDGEKADYFSGI